MIDPTTDATDATDELAGFEAEDDFVAVVMRLSRDLRKAAESLSETEVRYLVAAYYNIQELRIRCAAQTQQLCKLNRDDVIIRWLARQCEMIEGQIRAALNRFSQFHRFGAWPRSIIGIGPVIAAGLIAHHKVHIDHHANAHNTPTVGDFWSFAGLDPKVEWDRNEVRPWNADLKVLSWKIGQSFMKQQNHPKDIYGKVYRSYKDRYIARNESGALAPNAQRALTNKRYSRDTIAKKAYESGRLPPAHIDAMARRAAVKLFFAHFWEVCWRIDNPNTPPPLPYPIVHLGHAHIIHPPNYPL